MIPFIRSHKELMIITNSRYKQDQSSKKNFIKNIYSEKHSSKRKNIYNSKNAIELPNLPKKNRHNWIRSKEMITNFLDSLDYNNQIQASYDLTLLERQNCQDEHDVA